MSDKKMESYKYDFFDADHPNEVLDALKQFYVGSVFTDISLKCATGQVFNCHKAVLSARSSYFRIMFTADMRERSDIIIRLTGVDCDILGALVNYSYTAQICITENNVEKLLEAADLLQFNSVKQACQDFLIRFVDVDNCLGMHAFAQLHSCHALEREARRVMLSRFEELLDQEEFLHQDHDRLTSVLAPVNVSVWKDEVLIDAVVKWVAHDFDNRIDHLKDILHSICFAIDEINFKAALQTDGLLVDDGEIKSMITKALQSTCNGIPDTNNKNVHSSMYIIGGYYWHPLSEVHIWEPIGNTWTQGKDMPDYTRESYSVSLLGANIYVTGGYRTHTVEALDTVSVYNCDCDEWSVGCPMITARYYHCSVALRGCIYAIGGYRDGAPEEQAEFYDPLKKKWFLVTNMIQGVGNATACVMGDNIYVTGGHYGYRGSCTYEKIQVYKADINEWSVITRSPHPEYGLGSVSVHNQLYLVGGQAAIADCYDVKRNEWRPMSVMKDKRMECGAVVINGCIYVTGGYSYSKRTYLQSIEKYDPELDTWEIVGNLPSPSRYHGCVCVYSV